MATVLTDAQSKKLVNQTKKVLKAKAQEFGKAGKVFAIPDEHWSGVMPEDYRAELPGKHLAEGEVA